VKGFLHHERRGRPVYVLDGNAILSGTVGERCACLMEAFSFVLGRDCILVMDEIERIARPGNFEHVHDDASRLTSVLLGSLDDLPCNVVVVGVVRNYAELDRALLRRFHLRANMVPPRDDAWMADEATEWLSQVQRRMVVLGRNAANGELRLFVASGYAAHPEVSAARLHLRRRGIYWSVDEECSPERLTRMCSLLKATTRKSRE